MEERPTATAGQTAPATAREIETPQGTVAVLAVYTAVLIALWSFMYFLMVVRG